MTASEAGQPGRGHHGDDASVEDPDVAEWAEREHQRRQAWLKGPTEDEKRAWARRHGRRSYGPSVASGPYDPYDDSGPTDEEVDKWAHREQQRRRAWASGPTSTERDAYASRHFSYSGSYGPQGGSYGPQGGSYGPEDESYWDAMDRMRSDAYVAAEGVWSWLTEAPYRLWADAVSSGRQWEEGYGRPLRRRRISLYD